MRRSQSLLVFLDEEVTTWMFARTEELAAKFEQDQREVEMLKAVHEYAAPGWAEDENLTLNQALLTQQSTYPARNRVPSIRRN